jgi:hypothetical protein
MKPCADLDTFTWLYGQGQIGAVHCHWKRPASHSIGVCATRTDEGSLDWNCEEATQWITTVEYQLMVDEGYEVEVIPCPIKDKVALLAPPLPY